MENLLQVIYGASVLKRRREKADRSEQREKREKRWSWTLTLI
jgi:hypothetical protein